MLETRDRKQHDSRRKVWDRGFGARGMRFAMDTEITRQSLTFVALRDYEPRVDKYVNILRDRVAENVGKPMNVSKWLNYFSFDVMGELAFAHSFDMLQTGERHEVLDMLEKGQQPLGFLGMLPWLFNFVSKIPGAADDYNKWLAYCENLIIERQKVCITSSPPEMTVSNTRFVDQSRPTRHRALATRLPSHGAGQQRTSRRSGMATGRLAPSRSGGQRHDRGRDDVLFLPPVQEQRAHGAHPAGDEESRAQ